MEFVSLEEFNIAPVVNEKDEAYKSYVVLNRFRTKTKIGGIVLETCLRIYDYYLVFMTYDCPFEESLHISLLDKEGCLLEKKDIFAAYYTDNFSDLKLYPPNIVTFDFLYKGLWRIEILSIPKTLNAVEGLMSVMEKKDQLGNLWKVNLDLDKQTPTLSFVLKKLVLIFLCCCGLLYLFGYL